MTAFDIFSLSFALLAFAVACFSCGYGYGRRDREQRFLQVDEGTFFMSCIFCLASGALITGTLAVMARDLLR